MEQQQPYPLNNSGSVPPPEEEVNVVPIKQRLDSIAEDILTPRPGTKRKSAAKGRTAAQQKTPKAFRPVQPTTQQVYADQLQQIEAQVERINQILAERAHQKAQADQQIAKQFQSLSAPPTQDSPADKPPPQATQPSHPITPDPGQPFPSLEAQETEQLKQYARSLRQKLVDLESTLEEPEPRSVPVQSADPYPFPPVQQPTFFSPEQTNLAPQTSPAQIPPYSSQSQVWQNDPQFPDRGSQENQGAEEWQHLIHCQQGLEKDPERRRNSAEQFGAERYLRSRRPPDLANRRSLSLHRWRGWRYLEVPHKPLERFGDAALWIAGFAVVRVGFRYLVAAFPVLAPAVLLVMLLPAGLALYLAFWAPRVGWVPIYRLFLMTVGLLVGGNL